MAIIHVYYGPNRIILKIFKNNQNSLKISLDLSYEIQCISINIYYIIKYTYVYKAKDKPL